MKSIFGLLLPAVLLIHALPAETKVKLQDLPAAVQSAVKEQTKGATLVGLSKETEAGKIVYEVETKVGGKTRDLLMDSNGKVFETEDEVEMSGIPAAAQAAIRKKAGTGTVQLVEKLTAGTSVSYEGHIKTKLGKSVEVNVNPDGSPHKD